LVEGSGGRRGVVELMYAEESSLLGAAVAGAVATLDVSDVVTGRLEGVAW